MVVIYAKGRASNSLRDYAASRGWDDDIRAVSEPAALLRAMRAGKVEIVLASSLNGLARSSLELVELLREFVSRKVALIIRNQRLDTSKMSRKAITGMLDAIEEFKRVSVTAKTRQGLIAARKRGIKLGRPQTVNEHREDVKRLRARGLTGRAIAKELGIPSSTVFKLIKGVRGSLAPQVPDPFAYDPANVAAQRLRLKILDCGEPMSVHRIFCVRL